jgi:pimeloyl-ACP methyl ester carboxylesterase
MSLTDEGLVDVPGMLSRWVQLPSGERAHYMTSGESGPAVVLLHGGLPGSSGTAGWRFMAPFLGANGFRVYCPDQPGFGLSDPNRRRPFEGMHTYVDFLEEFVTAVCLDEFHIGGNSMGCMNTVNYVLAHPERVLSLAVIAGDFGDIMAGTKRPTASIVVPPWDGTAEGMRAMMTAIIHKEQAISDDLVEMRTRAGRRQAEVYPKVRIALSEFRGDQPYPNESLAARMSTKGRVDRLDKPAVYLYGRQDVLTPVEYGYLQEDRLPNIQFFYPDECGHQGQTDQPEIFNQLFLEFFRDGHITGETADRAGVSHRRPEIASLIKRG